MMLVAELLFVAVVMAVGVRWYLRTPMHRTRKNSGVHFPAQVAGHMGFGMYSPSNPPLLPHALHGDRTGVGDEQEPDAGVGHGSGDA